MTVGCWIGAREVHPTTGAGPKDECIGVDIVGKLNIEVSIVGVTRDLEAYIVLNDDCASGVGVVDNFTVFNERLVGTRNRVSHMVEGFSVVGATFFDLVGGYWVVGVVSGSCSIVPFTSALSSTCRRITMPEPGVTTNGR